MQQGGDQDNNMKGLVNYHIEEDEENYKIIIDADGIKGNNITKYSLEEKEIELHDPRDGRAELKFSKCGLQFVTYPTAVEKFEAVIDQSTKEVYEQELAELLKSNLENVEEVVVFDHTIRSDFSSSRPPVYHVHGDYTATSAAQRARDALGNRAEEWLGDGVHFGIVNVWRPIEYPVERSPLGFVDPSTVSPEDWHTISLIYPDRVGMAPGVVFREAHRWLVLDKMDPSMVWIFGQYDSHGLSSVPHSAVEIVGTQEDARPRKSIESRTLVRYRE